MKKLYHYCYTSHHEVLCRDDEDFGRLLCRIAQTSDRTNAGILAHALMSTHAHLIIETDSLAEFSRRLRHSYTSTFNCKYHRKGALGEKNFFFLELRGIEHKAAAISYVLKNPIHHHVCTNPFRYPYSSINLYFGSSIEHAGYKTEAETVQKHKEKVRKMISRKLLRRSKPLSDMLEMDGNGCIAPASFLEYKAVETIFGTYNAFQYNIHRRDFEEWKQQQMKDGCSDEPVTLQSIEPWMPKAAVEAFERKSRHWYKDEPVSDMELCRIIDTEIIKRYHRESYWHMTAEEKQEAAIWLMKKFNVHEAQVCRCLAIPYNRYHK